MVGLWRSRYLGLDVLSTSRTVNDTPTEYEATPVEESRHELINRLFKLKRAVPGQGVGVSLT